MVATKQGGAEPEPEADPIAGEWDVTVMMAPAFGGAYAEKTGTMVISGSNGSYVIESVAGETFNLAATFANNVLTAEKNGSTLTLTYDAAAGTLTQDGNEFQTWELPTTKSLVAIKQGGAVTPEPEPEPEPVDPWASDAVVTYDLPEGASSSRQVLRQIKYYADENNINIRLVASISKSLEKTDGLTISFYDKTNGTSGEGFYGWWKNAIGDVEYNAERCGAINGANLTMSVAEKAVAVDHVENGDLVTWTFAFPRSANSVLENNVVYMGVLTLDADWNATGAMPDKNANMLEVVLP